MLRILAFIIALTATAFAQQETSPANSKTAAIEELLTLMRIDRTVQQSLSQFQAAFSQQAGNFIPPGQDPELRSKMLQDLQEFQSQIFALVSDRLRFENVKADYIKIYEDMFSSEEINAILAFYRSPAGQALIERIPAVMERSGTVVQGIIKESKPEMDKLTNAWVEKMKAKYPDPGKN